MLITEKKPLEEILKLLEKDKNIFLVVCNGCPEACQTGGEKALAETKEALEKNGKTVTGDVLIDFLCNKMLVTTRLFRKAEGIKAADSILVLSCGIGVQTKRYIPAWIRYLWAVSRDYGPPRNAVKNAANVT